MCSQSLDACGFHIYHAATGPTCIKMFPNTATSFWMCSDILLLCKSKFHLTQLNSAADFHTKLKVNKFGISGQKNKTWKCSLVSTKFQVWSHARVPWNLVRSLNWILLDYFFIMQGEKVRTACYYSYATCIHTIYMEVAFIYISMCVENEKKRLVLAWVFFVHEVACLNFTETKHSKFGAVRELAWSLTSVGNPFFLTHQKKDLYSCDVKRSSGDFKLSFFFIFFINAKECSGKFMAPQLLSSPVRSKVIYAEIREFTRNYN